MKLFIKIIIKLFIQVLSYYIFYLKNVNWIRIIFYNFKIKLKFGLEVNVWN